MGERSQRNRLNLEIRKKKVSNYNSKKITIIMTIIMPSIY